MTVNKLALLVLALWLGPVGLAAQQGAAQTSAESKEYMLSARASWSEGKIALRLDIPIETLQMQTRYYASGVIEGNLSAWLYNGVKNLQINSRQTVQDFWGGEALKNPYTFFKNILSAEHAVFRPDLKGFESTYRISFYPQLIAAWLEDSGGAASSFVQQPLPPALRNTKASAFSGLVIYAADPLPVRGEPSGPQDLQPSLFLRLYDQELRLLLQYRHLEQQVLRQQGMVQYATTAQAAEFRQFVGSYPLRIAAAELFGSAPTDLILRNADAQKLLTNPSLRQALQKGRILVLCGALCEPGGDWLYRD